MPALNEKPCSPSHPSKLLVATANLSLVPMTPLSPAPFCGKFFGGGAPKAANPLFFGPLALALGLLSPCEQDFPPSPLAGLCCPLSPSALPSSLGPFPSLQVPLVDWLNPPCPTQTPMSTNQSAPQVSYTPTRTILPLSSPLALANHSGLLSCLWVLPSQHSCFQIPNLETGLQLHALDHALACILHPETASPGSSNHTSIDGK